MEVREGCLAPKKSESDWDPVEAHAKRVSSRLWSASSLIPLAESKVFDVGLQLGGIYHHADDIPVPALQKQVEQKVRAVLPQSSATAIRRAFSSAKNTTMAHKWAERIFAFIDRELRFRTEYNPGDISEVNPTLAVRDSQRPSRTCRSNAVHESIRL